MTNSKQYYNKKWLILSNIHTEMTNSNNIHTEMTIANDNYGIKWLFLVIMTVRIG